MPGPLILFAPAMCLTPGPNVVMITASGANFGFRRAIPHMLGISFGISAMALASGLGLAGLFQAEPRPHTAPKYAGAAHLLYRAGVSPMPPSAVMGPSGATDRLRRGDAVHLDESEAWVGVVGMLAAIATASGAMPWQVSVITAVLFTACLLSCAIWAAFWVAIERYLGSASARTAFNRSVAGLMVLSLIPVFW